MTKNLFNYLFFLLMLSCGGESGNSDAFNRQEEQVPEPEVLQSVYRADFRSVNPKVAKNVRGQVIIRIEQDSFEAALAVEKVPRAIHPQYVFNQKKCPTLKDDTNKDGYIDLPEAQAVTGEIFLPLDGDLGNASEDERNYPNGGFLNAFVYREETSRSRLLADLGPGADFNFTDRVVMILGADADEELPETVSAIIGRSPQESLPIACAELSKVIGQ